MNEKPVKRIPDSERSTPKEAVQNPARRRSVLIGGSVGTVLASMKSGSALAGGICISPSAYGSIAANAATSNRPTAFGQCSSRGWYGNNGVIESTLNARWSPVVRATATLQSEGFPSQGAWTMDTKLYDIVKAGSPLWRDNGNMIVIYLDVKTGKAGGTTTFEDVMDMWSILYGGVVVQTAKFASWNAATVKDFYKVWVGKTDLTPPPP